jgi:hypothetical protein
LNSLETLKKLSASNTDNKIIPAPRNPPYCYETEMRAIWLQTLETNASRHILDAKVGEHV